MYEPVTMAVDVERERLLWSFELAGEEHRLDLLPNLITGSVSVAVDGRVALRMPKPRFQDPWREAQVPIGPHTVVVALIHAFVMRTDLFVEGRSLIDGRSIEDARAAAPEPIRGYDLWFREFVFDRWWPSDRELALLIVVCLVGGAVIALTAVTEGLRPERAMFGALVVAFTFFPLAMGFGMWDQLTRWVNMRLLPHPEWGDVRRTLALAAAFVGIPVVAFLLLIAVIVALR